MRFLLDNDIPDRIGFVLIEEGHEVVFLRQVLPCDISDRQVFEYAVENHLIIITCNRDDFLALTLDRQHAGLIILVRRKSRLAECASLLKFIDHAGESGVAGNINFA